MTLLFITVDFQSQRNQLCVLSRCLYGDFRVIALGSFKSRFNLPKRVILKRRVRPDTGFVCISSRFSTKSAIVMGLLSTRSSSGYASSSAMYNLRKSLGCFLAPAFHRMIAKTAARERFPVCRQRCAFQFFSRRTLPSPADTTTAHIGQRRVQFFVQRFRALHHGEHAVRR